MATHKLKDFSYLAIIPRGLQNEISSGLKKQAKALAASGTNDSSNQGSTKNDEGDDLKVCTWNEKEEEETVREALREFSKQKKEKEERKKLKAKSIAKHQPNEPYHLSDWLPPECSVGSVKLPSSQQHVSIGYFQKYGDDDKKKDGFVPCMTCTGQLAGSAWMQLETDRRDVSQRVLAPSRMLGPLLALVSVQTDNRCLEAVTPTTTEENASPLDLYQRYHQHSLEEMTTEVTRHIESNPNVFSKRVDRALQVWRDCVEATWKDRLSTSEYAGLQNRIQENRLRFRISCVRVEPSIVPSSFSRKRKKKIDINRRELFAYSRQELCLAMMDACGRKLVPGFYDSGNWSVNLEKFDIELVIFITPPDLRSKNGKLALGISLCPYSFLQSKSFETGNVPPDVTTPYLGKDILTKGIVRLRPTTAQLLLQIANLQKYDIVLDPCAGVGTIPVEAEQYHKRSESTHRQGLNESKHFVSIGGDLILNNPKYTQVAGLIENFNGRKNGGLKSSSLLVAWDATHLPMRTSSVDVVASDLPFGQQCLSVSALQQLLPLVFLECARVLTPTTGRMVILAGGSPLSVIAMIRELSGKYWKKPISRVSPVSIGGILAWILRVDRNDETFDRDSVPSQLDRVRKITQKRDRINRQRKSDSGEQLTGKRKKRNK